MENTTYTIDEQKTQRAIRRTFRRAQRKRRLKVVGKWISENKEATMVLVPALIGLATVVVRSGARLVLTGARRINLSKEEKLKDLYCYDRSLGHYWKLRRKLTNNEWAIIDARKKNGERMADILTDLNVLK